MTDKVTPLPKAKKRKAPTKKRLTDLCDETFSLIIRASRGPDCENCGNSVGLQCAHGLTRGYYATRWDERNAYAICQGCHVFFTHRPIEWEAWMEQRTAPDVLAELRALALTHRKPDVEELLPKLRARLAQIENDFEDDGDGAA